MTTRHPHLARSLWTFALASAGLAGLAAGRGVAGEAAKPVSPADNKGAVTFNKDIAPIVFERCASCHRPGEVAPFSLLSFKDASKRAELIRTVTEERSMPPWKAQPGFGHFADERRLTDDQLALIDRWVKAGAPEGDPSDLPPTPKFATGWQLGEPDMVVKMAEPYALAAEGADEYRCFVIPVQLPPGKYLQSVEYRPGNRRVVHHAVLTTLPHRVAQAKLAEGDGKSFASGLAPPGKFLPGPLAFWTPGMVPQPLPDGYAADWPKQADLVLQLHLHPSGKPETEQSSIGLHFTDQKPKGRLELLVINDESVDIPEGEANHEVKTGMTLPGPADLYGIFPHMHLIGRSVKVTATLPDGTVTPLIAIGDWNFNWQFYYRYATPLKLPSGTRIDCRWTFDNSAANPANPSHPPKRVRYGEQTTNEMAILIMDVIPTGKWSKGGARHGGDPSSRPARREGKDGGGH